MLACTSNKVHMRKVLARQHGVCVATIENWERAHREKMQSLRQPAQTHISVQPPPAQVVVQSQPRAIASLPQSTWLRQLAAQALFLAEQLESLANSEMR